MFHAQTQARADDGVGSGNAGRVIVGELGAVDVEIEVLGAVRRAIEEHQSTAIENAVDDGLGQISVMQHGAPGGQRDLLVMNSIERPRRCRDVAR